MVCNIYNLWFQLPNYKASSSTGYVTLSYPYLCHDLTAGEMSILIYILYKHNVICNTHRTYTEVSKQSPHLYNSARTRKSQTSADTIVRSLYRFPLKNRVECWCPHVPTIFLLIFPFLAMSITKYVLFVCLLGTTACIVYWTILIVAKSSQQSRNMAVMKKC